MHVAVIFAKVKYTPYCCMAQCVSETILVVHKTSLRTYTLTPLSIFWTKLPPNSSFILSGTMMSLVEFESLDLPFNLCISLPEGCVFGDGGE